VRIVVVGAGSVGARVVRQLASTPEVAHVAVVDLDGKRRDEVVASVADRSRVQSVDDWTAGADAVDVVVLAHTSGTHREIAERALDRNAHVVSASDGPEDVEALLALDAEATERGRAVVVGAAFGPGLSDVLVAHAAATFDAVEEIHISRLGTGGPACARQHHRALAGEIREWRDGAWTTRRAGSGRELAWFPDPIGPADCYRANIPDGVLLQRALPSTGRITARLAATRRDRLTARLPMLRRPHQDGGVGAIRVEVRGRRGSTRDVVVLGAMDRPAVAAGAVAAVAATVVASGATTGARGVGSSVEPVPFLAELARRGVKAATFVGNTG
jgi:saccharopine dehydrogenase-like NADP-dependent oxidoreductase